MRSQNLIRTFILMVVIAFAAASLATAGAVFRGRGNDRDKDRGKSDNRPSVSRDRDRGDSGRSQSQRPERGNWSRSERENSYRPERGNPNRSDRGNWSRSERDNSYRPEREKSDRSDRGNSSRSEREKTYRPSEKTMRDRGKPDATPAYKRDEPKRSSSRESSSWTRDRKNSDYRDRYDDRNTSKYRRVEERRDGRSRVSYRAPRHRGGYYYYDYGWPSYTDFACRYRYWVFDYDRYSCHRSVYYYYGYFPYIPIARVVIIRRPVIAYVEIPIVIRQRTYYYDDGYYLDRPGYGSVERALWDIRRAWTSGDPDLLIRHTRSDIRIDVLLDDDYAYSVDASDYRDMTRDAIGSTDTIDFDFDSVRGRGDDRVIAYGRHEFYTRSGDRKTVYVSYLLERHGGEWVIIEVGSSVKRIY